MAQGAAIVEASRSAIAKRNGGQSGVHPADLSAQAQVLKGVVRITLDRRDERLDGGPLGETHTAALDGHVLAPG